MRLSITVAIVATVATVAVPLASVDFNTADPATLPPAGQTASAPPAYRFPTAVSSNGRYFVDQVGDPIPLFVDHQWNLIARGGEWDETGVGTTTPQAVFEGYAAIQAANGFNAVQVLAISSAGVEPANADGSTWDGIVPFGTGGIGDLNEPYWSRVDAFLDACAAKGLTVILNLVSSYTLATGQAMNGLNTTNGATFGTAIGNRYKDTPNLIYQFGVDYFGSHEDDFAAITDAIQATGDTHLVTVQYMAESNTRTDSNDTPTDTFGASTDISYDEIYSYNANYVEVERAYQLSSPAIRPTFMANGHYDQSSTTSTYDWHLMADLMGWALTSGSKGMFYGSEDTWQWNSGAYKALPDLSFPNGPWGATITWFTALDGWQKLVPDFGSAFIRSSRGTKLAPITPGGAGGDYNNTDPQNDYLTGAVTPDGTLALLYTPTARAITINTAEMVASYTAKWVDPYDGSVTAAASSASSYTTPGTNSGGDHNWYLLLEDPTGPTATPGDPGDPGDPRAISAVRFSKVQYDSPGNETGNNKSLNHEWVVVMNHGNKAKYLTGWTIRDRQGHVFKFPTFKLKPGKRVKLHTGKGTNSNKDLYWKQNSYVWRNTGDKAILKNKSKTLVDSCKWGDGGGSSAC